MFERNQRICLKTDHNHKGRVNDIPTKGSYEVIWDNSDIEIVRENEIQNEIIIQTPWERLTNNQFDDFRNFTISSIINKVDRKSVV
jgi:hypothetical protein